MFSNNQTAYKAEKEKTANKLKRTIIITLLAVLGLILFSASSYTVRENQAAYITRFSKMVDIKDEPNLYFKIPFIDNVKMIPTQQMLYDIPPSDVITADKQALVVDNFAVWKITDPAIFMRTIASISEMENRINASVYSTIKNMFGSMTREEIINEDVGSVDKVSEKVTENVNKTLSSYGITVSNIEIKRVDLPTSNAAAVYNRMITERNQIAEGYIAEGLLEAQKIRNDTDKEVAIILADAEAEANKIMGEGEEEYMKILADAYATPAKAEFYKFVRGLDALKVTMDGDNRTLILNESSYIVQLLLGAGV